MKCFICILLCCKYLTAKTIVLDNFHSNICISKSATERMYINNNIIQFAVDSIYHTISTEKNNVNMEKRIYFH